MTVTIETATSIIVAAPATIFIPERDTDESWATPYMVANKNLKWIRSNYVQSDAANNNGHFWSYEDLKQKMNTILHAPLNIGHQQHHIVGHYAAAQMIHPTESAADAHVQTPYVETLAAVYRFYFPEEAAQLDAAFAQGNLWQSMECIAETLTCKSDGGCGKTFPYKGVRSETYCDEINSGGVKQFNNPTFLGGGMIIPPVKPGWTNAVVRDISQLVRDQIEGTLEEVEKTAPDMTPEQWEASMQALLEHAEQKNN